MLGFFGRREGNATGLRAVSISETGLVRPDNQDHVYVDPDAGIFAVADGMGGASDGARASAIVCSHLRLARRTATPGRPLADVAAALDAALGEANAEIFRHAREHGFAQMGSTAAIVALDTSNPVKAAIGHIGDSRVYRIRRGLTEALTRDHTVASVWSDFAGAKAAACRDRSNPLAHVLTRAVGVAAGPLGTEWTMVDAAAGDRFVICSDGVHDVITDRRLAVYVSGGTLESARTRLARAVVAQGAPDNYSFVIVEVGENA